MAFHNISEVEQSFKSFLSSIDHPLEKAMLFDTPEWQRFPCPYSKSSKTSARYKAHSDGVPTLLVKCHRCHSDVIKFSHKSDQNGTSSKKWRRKKPRKNQHKEKEAEEYIQILIKLKADFNSAAPCLKHQYLLRKNVAVTELDGLKIDEHGQILCPLRLITGELISVQTISIMGGKYFYKDLIITNGFHSFGSIQTSDVVYFGEGIATCLTIRMVTGKAVICIYGKRFAEMAPIIEKAFPEKKFIYCCDLPSAGEKLTSEDNARKAIVLTGGSLTHPDFSEFLSALAPEINRTDFNDYFSLLLAQGFSKDDAISKTNHHLLTNIKDFAAMDEKPKKEPYPPNFTVNDSGLMEGNLGIVRAMATDLESISKYKSIGRINGMSAIGYVMGPLMGGFLSDSTIIPWFYFSFPFFLAMLFSMAAVALAAFMLYKKEKTVSDHELTIWRRFNLVSRFKFLFRSSRALKYLLIIGTIFTFSVDLFFEFGPVYLTGLWSMTPAGIAVYNAALSFTLAIGAGWLPHHLSLYFSINRVIITSMLITAFILGLMAAFPFKILVFLLFGIIGLSIATVNTNMTIQISNSASKNIQGEAMGAQLSLRMLGDAIICLSGGFLIISSVILPIAISCLITGLALVMYIFKICGKN